MINIILGLTLALALSGAIAYIIKSKKNGQKCIGCPSGCHCKMSRTENTRSHCKTEASVAEE